METLIKNILIYHNYTDGFDLYLSLYLTEDGRNLYRVFAWKGFEIFYEKAFENYEEAYIEFYELQLDIYRKNNPERLNISLYRLRISTRSRNCLLRRGISKISELKELTVLDLRKIRGLGKVHLSEILEALKEFDIELEEE